MGFVFQKRRDRDVSFFPSAFESSQVGIKNKISKTRKKEKSQLKVKFSMHCSQGSGGRAIRRGSTTRASSTLRGTGVWAPELRDSQATHQVGGWRSWRADEEARAHVGESATSVLSLDKVTKGIRVWTPLHHKEKVFENQHNLQPRRALLLPMGSGKNKIQIKIHSTLQYKHCFPNTFLKSNLKSFSRSSFIAEIIFEPQLILKSAHV